MSEIAGTILAIATRTRNGAKWQEITVDIDSKGEQTYVHKASIRHVKDYADQVGVECVRDLVGRKITFVLDETKPAAGGQK